MSKSISYSNLTGGLNTVQDYATINSNPSRTETPDMLNIEYYKLGGIQTMKGNTQIGNSLGAKVTAGYEYIIGNNVYLIVTTETDNIYEYDKLNDTFTPIGTMSNNASASSEEYHPRHCIVGYDNGVVIVNGWSVYYYNKTTGTKTNYIPQLQITGGTSSSSGSTDTETIKFHPNCVVSLNGRLFMGANSVETDSTTTYNGGMLFYSGVGLGIQETWKAGTTYEDAGAFKEFFEDTSNFTALGTWAEFIVIHKIQNTFILDVTGDTSDAWTLKHYSEYTTDSQQSYVKVNNGYYTYVKEAGGIYALLTRSIYNNTYQGGDFSAKIKDSFEYLDTERYNEIYATYNPKKKYIMFYMPMTDNVTSEGEFNGSSDCFIMDLQTKSWLHRKVPQYVTAAFKFDDNTYIGTSDGLVLQEFRGKAFNGEAIQFHYITPPFLWGGGTNKTTTKEFRVKLVGDQSNHFYIESYRDGNHTAKSKRLVKNVGDNLGGLIWDLEYNYPTPVEGSTTQFTDLGDANPANFTYDASSKIYTIKQITSTYYRYPYNGSYAYTQTPPCGETGTETLQYNIPVYLSTTNSIRDGLSQNSKYVNTTSGTASNHTRVTYTTATSYAWNQQNPTDLCYRYVDSTYGTYYAWVNSSTGVCNTNIVKSSVTTPTLIGFNGVLVTNYANTAIVGVGYSDYQNYWNTAGRYIYAYLWNNNTNAWEHTRNGVEMYIYTSAQPDGTDYNNNKGRVLCFYVNGSYLAMYGIQSRNTSHDTSTTTTIEKPSGTVPLNYTKSYTSGTNSITINITGVGSKSFSRYSALDRGTATSTTNYYTSSRSPSTGTNAYTTAALTTSYGSIAATTSNTITVNGVTLTYNSNANGTRQIPHYWIDTSIFATAPTVVSGTAPVYTYPLLGEDEVPKSLTDTVWDYTQTDEQTNQYILARPTTELAVIQGKQAGNIYEDVSLVNSSYTKYDEIANNLRGDAWLAQGYQTKRMLLPTQYFEVIQFRFSGGYNETNNQDSNYDDNLCITGFEVDGIQLAETPMA